MISIKEFYQRWNKQLYPLIQYEKDIVLNLRLPENSKKLLFEAGLPESATPFLNFALPDRGGLSRLNQLPGNEVNKDEYIYLGFTGEGDFVCAIEESGLVVRVDHEDPSREQFINSSILQLAECLLEYDEFVEKIMTINGDMAYLDNDAPTEFLDILIKKFISVDENIFTGNSFWAEEMSNYPNCSLN